MGEVWFLGLGANTWQARERDPIPGV